MSSKWWISSGDADSKPESLLRASIPLLKLKTFVFILLSDYS